MTAQSDHFASAVQPPVAAAADGATLPLDQRGTRRTQNNSNHLPSRWRTLTLDQRLTELHAAGLSFADIATQLNTEFAMHMSRNAAIGRASRMQLPPRTAYQTGKIVRPVKAHKKPRPAAPKPRQPASTAPRNLSLIKLTHHDCRYPFGDVAPYLFCAQPVVHGSSWCITHFRIVHTP